MKCRGTRIIINNDYVRDWISQELMVLSYSRGFKRIELPSIEPIDTYLDKAGPEILDQMYVFKDKKGRDICLRPECTATIQRLAKKDHWKEEVRLWYFEKCWRYERPQKGRYREFWQFGCEIINPKKDYTSYLINLASEMIEIQTDNYEVKESVKRGLDYYVSDGFEIVSPQLGAQQQICGGGAYDNGMGFAIGFDRLMLCK